MRFILAVSPRSVSDELTLCLGAAIGVVGALVYVSNIPGVVHTPCASQGMLSVAHCLQQCATSETAR